LTGGQDGQEGQEGEKGVDRIGAKRRETAAGSPKGEKSESINGFF